MTQRIVSFCLTCLLFMLPATCAAQDVLLEYDPVDGNVYLTATPDANGDFSISSIVWESPSTPLSSLDGTFVNGSLFTGTQFGGSFQLSAVPGIQSPVECFFLASYPTGLTLDDFGTFAAAANFDPGSPGTTIFGDMALKNVPEPSTLLLGLALAPMLWVMRRSRSS